MTKNLIGPDPSQVPTNGMLGTMAFQDAEDVAMGDMTASGLSKFGAGAAQSWMIADAVNAYLRTQGNLTIGSEGGAGFLEFVAGNVARARILAGGNTVFGATTEDGSGATLQVAGNASVSGITNFGTGAAKGWANSDANAAFFYGAKSAFYGTTGNYNLSLITNNLERARFTNDGKLLIGATAEDGSGAKVQITGNALSVSRQSGEGDLLLGANDGYFYGNATEAGWWSPTKGKWKWDFAAQNLFVGTNAVWHAGNLAKPAYCTTSNDVKFAWATPTAGQVGLTIDETYKGYLWHSGNLDPANYMPKTGGTFSGRITMYANGGTPEIQFTRPDGGASAYLRPWSNNGNAGIELVNSAYNAVRFSIDDGGNLWAAGNVSAYSDESVKTDWTPFAADFIDRLAAVKHGAFTRTDTGERQVGVGAQSLQKVIPEAVVESDEGKLSVVYGHAALASAIALAQEVKALRQRIAELEAAA